MANDLTPTGQIQGQATDLSRSLFAGVEPAKGVAAEVVSPSSVPSMSSSGVGMAQPPVAPPLSRPPSGAAGFKQAFVPAVGVPELQSQSQLSNTAGTTFNAGNVEAVTDIDFAALNKAETRQSSPSAGIMQGKLPTSATPDQEVQKKPEKKKLSKKQIIYLFLGGFFILVLLIMGVSLLMGQDPAPVAEAPVAKPRVLLEYWGLWQPDEVMTAVFRDYEKSNNVTINYHKQSIIGYREKLQDAILSGNGPDLFRYHLTWQPMLAQELAVANNPEIPYSKAEFSKTFYPVADRVLNGEAGIDGVPLMHDGLVLLYNQEIFDKAGEVTEPKDWGTFKNLARRLTIRDERGGIVQAGAAIGLISNVDHGSDLLGLLALQYGVNLSFPDPVDTENNAKMERALQDFTSYYNDEFDVPGTRVWDESFENSLDAFAAGKVAMIFVPTYRLLDLQNMNPDLKVRVATLPVLGKESSTWASFWVEGVNAKSPNNKQLEAWKLLKYLSSPEVLQKLYQEQLTLGRPIGEIYPRVDMAALLSTDRFAQPLLKDAPRNSTFYICDNTWDNGLNDNLIKYYEDAVTEMTLGLPNRREERSTAAEALALIQKGTVEQLIKYGVRK